jgi:acyl carrier protein
MDKDQLLARLRTILREEVGITQDVQLTTALVREGIVDSMQFFNYLIWVEETFKISVPEEDVIKYELGVMGNMVNYLAEKES